MNVYVVTSGCYSDYNIEVIFSTKELAEDWVKISNQHNRYSSYAIEEWEVDKLKESKFIKVWVAWILINDGTIFNETSSMNVTRDFRGRVVESNKLGWKERRYSVVESTISQDHCRKLAVEERQKVLRETMDKARK